MGVQLTFDMAGRRYTTRNARRRLCSAAGPPSTWSNKRFVLFRSVEGAIIKRGCGIGDGISR